MPEEIGRPRGWRVIHWDKRELPWLLGAAAIVILAVVVAVFVARPKEFFPSQGHNDTAGRPVWNLTA